MEEHRAIVLDTGDSEGTPVVPCIVGSSVTALKLSDALLRRGINANPILYRLCPKTKPGSTRIDLRLCMTDQEGETAALSCPIHAFGGSDDPLVSESDLHEWGSRTCDEFSVQILPGGHFYLGDGPQLFGPATASAIGEAR